MYSTRHAPRLQNLEQIDRVKPVLFSFFGINGLAALMSAMREYVAKIYVGVPINTIELDNFMVCVVKIPMNDTMKGNARNFLRAVSFYRTDDINQFKFISDTFISH